ncbi:MAG: 6-bladed beta-propeller [Desulfuromonadaceae bacterium]
MLNDAAWQDEGLNVIWPHPPERARIKLLKVIDGPQDVVDSSRGTMGKFFEFITGAQEKNIDFYTPQCIAADGNGLIYVADPSVGLIHRYDLAAKEVQYIFQAGDKKLGSPVGVALDAEGNLYVTDALLAAVFKFNPDGKLLRELDGKGNLKRPAGIAVTAKGDKVVADILANKVFIFGKDDELKGELLGFNSGESFNKPTYVAIDRSDTIYVTDSMNFTIRVFDESGRYMRSIGQIGDAPGSFARPKGIALDSDQNLYVLDSIFANFQLFNQKGQLLLYVGQEGSQPGQMMLPSGIFIDKNDRIYVADTFNHRIQIYQYLKEKVPQ